MVRQIIKKDIIKNRMITIMLFLFMMMAAMLVSGGINIMTTLTGAVDGLFEKAQIPHYMQMHSGSLNQAELNRFTADNPLIKSQQTVEMVGIDGAYLFLSSDWISESRSITENGFVKQNQDFDFLLDMDNQILDLEDGEIGVPIYHMQKYGLKMGDQVWVKTKDFQMQFTIRAFIRDAQMNPPIVTSKRFLVSDRDFETLKAYFNEWEYLIEFQLYDTGQAAVVESMYQEAGLPASDTGITFSLYRLMSALTDGIVAAILLFISILLVGIAALCLRFTLITTIAEDSREIGVMKAIGITNRDIRRLYLTKYVVIAAAANVCGYLASAALSSLFISNILLFMGAAKQGLLQKALPALGTLLLLLLIMLYCALILNRFKRISPVTALGQGQISTKGSTRSCFSLHNVLPGNLNIYLGIRSVLSRARTYGPVCLVFVVCSFLMILPLSLLNTVKAPEFITYMGAGRSDFRIDLHNWSQDDGHHQQLLAYLEADRDIALYGEFTTATYKIGKAGEGFGTIKVENGHFTSFPLEYSKGRAPAGEHEVALSVLCADDLEKDLGDAFTIRMNETELLVTVCGIYQDVTNGGRTAKGYLPYEEHQILWQVVNVKLKAGTDLQQKLAEYQDAFPGIKITDMEDYMSQTLGGIIRQLTLAARLAMILAVAIAAFITALFFRMQLASDYAELAIMRSLGLSNRDVRLQYTTAAAVISLAGVLIGMAGVFLIGPKLAGLLLSGVLDIRFTVNPFLVFAVCPMVLAGTAIVTAFITTAAVKNINARVMAG